MQAKRVDTFLLALASLMIVGSVAINIKDGFDAFQAEAKPTGKNILYIGGAGPNNYTGINFAIENASDGDIIKVEPGTYEPIVINKEIRLIGDPVIDAHGGVGIAITANNTLIENFTIYNGSVGIYVHNASFTLHNITIRNCTVYDCLYQYAIGIKFENVDNSTIEGCEIYNNTLWGIQLLHSSNNTICNNNVYNHTSEWNSAGIVAFSSSNHNNISSNVVYNNGIDSIEFWNNSFYNTIWNNTIYNSEYGILLSRNANNNTIAKNNIHGNTYGIGLGHTNTTWGGVANNNMVIGNNINNNTHGIHTVYSSYNLIMTNTIINNNGGGIYLEHSDNNSLLNNIINNNKYGIHLFYYSLHNLVANNTILNNNDEGIYLYSSANANIIRNNSINNNNYGVRILHSYNNLIYNNYVQNTINAFDNSNNIWNISKTSGINIIGGLYLGGNYWHDYNGVDINGDGLGDTNLPYNCSQNIQNGGDWLPLVESNYAPVANDDFYSTDEDTTLIVNAPGILGNDTDADGDVLTAELVSSPSHGSIILNSNGSFEYTPDPNYHGTDSFTYKAYDGEAYSNTATVTITINSINDPPVANFSYSPLNPTDLDTINFTDLSYDLDGFIVNWTWNFGDGNYSYEQNPSHQYSNDGTYDVSLTVKDDDGAVDSITKQIIVSNIPPVANFSYSPLNAVTTMPVYFTDLSYDLDGNIVSWHWEFGDGGYSNQQNPSHQYTNEGIYVVNLTVWDDDGANDTVSKNITVIKPSPDYILITFSTKNEIQDCSISTNFSFIAYASAFNNTYGFIEFVNANWSILNNASNVTINSTQGKSILFNSGNNDGMAILKAEYNGLNDTVGFNINSSLFSFILYKGWNLITLPCENDYNASSLYDAIEGCSIILSWNASMQDFILYVPGVPYDFAIEDGHGYFIGMNHDSIFSLTDIPLYNVSVSLYVGWNILGWFNSWQTDAISLYTAIDNCSIVLKWNASLQDFELYAPGVPNNFIISRGEGFLVAVSQQSIWHGE